MIVLFSVSIRVIRAKNNPVSPVNPVYPIFSSSARVGHADTRISTVTAVLFTGKRQFFFL
jgi:hypothetical protein